VPYDFRVYTYVSACDIGPKAVQMFADADPKTDDEALAAATKAAAFLCETLPKVEVNLVREDGTLVKKWMAFPAKVS
jgi:hypothetical protein